MKSILKKTIAAFSALMILLTMTAFNASASTAYKYWLQSDSRWGSMTLGANGETMSQVGCAVTSLAIIAVHSGCADDSSFDPGVLCRYLREHDGFDSFSNLYWSAVSGLLPDLSFRKKQSFSSNTKSMITAEIAANINAGYYIIISVGYDSHWVAVDTVKDGEVLIMDPAQNATNNLFDKYDASGILQMRLYKGRNTPAKTTGSTSSNESTNTNTTPTVTTTINSFCTGHYKTTAALNLRSSNTTSSDILVTIPNNTTISITGFKGNWGATSYSGKNGYVCMDYVTFTGNSEASFKPGSYKVSDKDGVNLRTGAGISNNKLCVVPYNTTLKMTSFSSGWGKTTYNGKSGYVCMDYLTYAEPAKTTQTAAKVTTTTTKTTTAVKATTKTTTKAAAKSTAAKAATRATTATKAITTTTVITTQPPSETDISEISQAEPAITGIKGDANGDGVVNVRDAAYIAKCLAKGMGDALPANADTTSKGNVNVRDAAAIAKSLATGQMIA